MVSLVEENAIYAEKLRVATLYGIVAGFTFATVAWGYDAVRLVLANGIYAWLPYLVGLVLCAAVGGLAGWLSYRLNHFLSSFLIWLAVGIFFGWLSNHLPLDIFSRMITLVNPGLGQMLQYDVVPATLARGWISRVAVVGLTTIAGVLAVMLADATFSSTGQLGRYFPMVFWMFLFFLAGLAVENNLSEPLSAPVIAVNEVIQYADEHPSESLAYPKGTNLRLGALLDIQQWIHQPRQLILQGYDDALFNTTVLIHFPSGWAVCSVSDNQPGYCKAAASPPSAQ